MSKLSKREDQIMAGIISGKAVKILADELGIKPGTLHVHLGNIYKRLGVHKKAEAIAAYSSMSSVDGPEVGISLAESGRL